MIGLILSLALIPQGTSQARLHPADALLLVEVPDVAKMLAAYEKAPMIQMLRDPEAQKGFYGAFEGSGIDFDELVAEALSQAGMPETFANAPLAGIRHYLEGVQATSFSFSFDKARLEEAAPRLAHLEIAGEEIDTLASAIESHRGTSDPTGSTLPADLSVLGLEPSATLDPWERPYEYKPLPDGTYVLRSLGADGKEGGTGDAADIDAKSVDEAPEALLGMFGFQGVIEFRNPAALQELHTLLAGLFAKSDAAPLRTGPFQMSGVQGELQSWNVAEGDGKPFEIWMMRVQNSLVIGGGTSSPETYASRLADPRVKTAAEQFYAGLLADFGPATGATIVQGTLRLSDYVETLGKLAELGGETDMLAMMEGMLPNASLRMQLVGERFITEMASRYPKPNPMITAALGIAPLPQEILTMLPPDAIGAYVSSVDGPLMWKGLQMEFTKDAESAEEVARQFTEIEEQFHFSVERDIFGSLGKGLLIYVLPLKGLTSIPSSIAMVADLKDPEAMKRGIDGLMALLGENAGEELQVRSKPYRDMPMWSFDFSQSGGGGMDPLMNSFSPSISLVKNRMIVTLNAQHMKKEIKRALGEEQGAHLITTEGHRPPANATAFAYMDWAHLLDGAYEGGRSLLGMMGGGDLPVDLARLPEPGVFTRFYKPTIYYTRTIPGGTYLRNESSFGPEVWAALIGAGGLAGFAASEQSEMIDESMGEEDTDADESEPAEAAAAGGAQAAATRTEMSHVATAIAVYRMDLGKYPKTLDELLSPTKNYPRGFLEKTALPNDGWGRGFKYLTLENGARFKLWSLGPDGVDQQGAGDDLVSP